MTAMASMSEILDNINTEITPEQDEILMEPYTYIKQVPISDVWRKLITAINYWLQASPEVFKTVVDNCEMACTASLMVDDIQNDAETRKGIPTAHCTFGMPITLNSYYYAASVASSNILDLSKPEAIKIYRKHLLESCKARRMVIYWRDTVTCPTEEEYEKMLVKKSLPLLSSPVKLLELFGTCKKDLTKLNDLLGLYIHISEDYERLKNSTDPESKSYAEDVARGLFTYPIIHAINTNPEDGEAIMEILRQRPSEVELKKYVLTLLERFGSYDYTLEKLRKLKEEIIAEAKKIGDNPELDILIKNCMNV